MFFFFKFLRARVWATILLGEVCFDVLMCSAFSVLKVEWVFTQYYYTTYNKFPTSMILFYEKKLIRLQKLTFFKNLY